MRIKTLLMGGPADGEIVMLEPSMREYQVIHDPEPLIVDSRFEVPTLTSPAEVRYSLAPYRFSEELQIFMTDAYREVDAMSKLFDGYSKGVKSESRR